MIIACITSKQSTISGWDEHDVRISVPFTRDTTHANTEIMRDCHVFGTLAKQAYALLENSGFLPDIELCSR